MRTEPTMLAQINAMPPQEQLKLALSILQNIDETGLSADSEAHPDEVFFTELDRRYQDMLSGVDAGIPADKVIQSLV